MRRIVLLSLGGVATIGLAVGALWLMTELRYQRTWEEIPYPDIERRTEPETLARGEYLAWNVVGCGKCHLPHTEALAHQPGERPALRGGWKLAANGFGTFYVPNITPDQETGIGNYSAPEIGRAIRTGVLRDGRIGMTMAGALGDMTDGDLEAVVSYIMIRPAVRNELPPDETGPVFKVVLAWFFDPYKWPGAAVVGSAPSIGATVERGKYLVTGPANCVMCHSPRNAITFKDDGPKLSGANPEPDMQNPDMEWAAPNLTPDPKTGHIASWTEDQFVARMRAGRVFTDSNMPWESFRGMDELDLRAIFRYLQGLEPVVRATGPTYRNRGWTADGS